MQISNRENEILFIKISELKLNYTLFENYLIFI